MERLEVLATELREELGRESEATGSELAEDLAAALDRIRTELRVDLGSSRVGMEGRLGPAGERASGELGARIESWIEDVRARSDSAEKRLEEERERRIVAAEARVEARGQEMLRTIRGDLDASRADADAAMVAALALSIKPSTWRWTVFVAVSGGAREDAGARRRGAPRRRDQCDS